MSVVADLVFAEPPAAAGGAWPFLGAEVWPRRLRDLQAHPGRWVQWRGCSTTSLRRSIATVSWAARGLAGTYEFRSGECEAGGPLTFVRWTPPVEAEALDLRPLARAETPEPVGLVVVDPASELVAASSVTGSAVPACRGCGCTDAQACPGGCWWAEVDLCSRCAGAAHGLLDIDGAEEGSSVAVPAPEDGLPPNRPHSPGAVSTPDGVPPATVTSGFQGPEVVGVGTPAPECSAPATPEPRQGEPQLLRGPTVGRRAGGVGAAPLPPLLKCGSCWRKFAGPEALADHEAAHARAGAVS